ncbi:MAG: hypothetical protein K6B67_09385 [Lachnospiraceae bacterium]|nr:hypothetical protein [Lachnospiraceae bacterium]
MVAVFIAVLVVLIFLIYFITVSIRIVGENAEKKINAYFLSKLEDYDKDFKDKIKTLNKLQEQKEELESQVAVLEADRAELQVSRFYKPRPVIRDTFIPIAHYIDNGFFSDYKYAKKLLDLNKEEIIRTVMENNPYTGDLKRYQIAESLLNLLNPQAMYDMVTLPGADQMQVFFQGLQGDDMSMFLEYLKTMKPNEEFQILEFHKWLRKVSEQEDPYLHVYMAELEDYSYVSEYVECFVDDNVCEGIRIVYQGLLFDYSIYESRKRK